MESIVLNIKDQSKYLSFIQFVRQLDFVEVKETTKKNTITEKYDLFASAGLWKNKNVNAKELRAKAWNQQK